MPTSADGSNMSKQKTKPQKEKISLCERICKSLDLQPDLTERDTLVQIRGRNKTTVQGAYRIISYSPTDVRLETKKGELLISGKRLFCSSYSRGFVEIDGLINEVIFGEVE